MDQLQLYIIYFPSDISRVLGTTLLYLQKDIFVLFVGFIFFISVGLINSFFLAGQLDNILSLSAYFALGFSCVTADRLWRATLQRYSRYIHRSYIGRGGERERETEIQTERELHTFHCKFLWKLSRSRQELSYIARYICIYVYIDVYTVRSSGQKQLN